MINVCQVPHLKGLRTEHLIDLIVNDCEGEDYLPSNYLKYRPNRSWLCKICSIFLSLIMLSEHIKQGWLRELGEQEDDAEGRTSLGKEKPDYQHGQEDCSNFHSFDECFRCEVLLIFNFS